MGVDKEKIYNQIKNAITTTELEANMKLNDSFLMERFKVTRTPLREILLRLHNEGLVDIVPRMGTIVKPLEINRLREIVEMRKELEEFAAKLAAKKRNESHLSTLRQLIDRYRDAKEKENIDFEYLAKLDTEFHETIYAAADNKELTRCANRMRILMLRYWYNAGFGGVEFLSHFNTLELILKGIENQDCKLAQNATREHIEDFINQLKEIIK